METIHLYWGNEWEFVFSCDEFRANSSTVKPFCAHMRRRRGRRRRRWGGRREGELLGLLLLLHRQLVCSQSGAEFTSFDFASWSCDGSVCCSDADVRLWVFSKYKLWSCRRCKRGFCDAVCHWIFFVHLPSVLHLKRQENVSSDFSSG